MYIFIFRTMFSSGPGATVRKNVHFFDHTGSGFAVYYTFLAEEAFSASVVHAELSEDQIS